MSETLTSPSSRQADLIPQPDLITVSVHTQWHTIFPSPSNIYPLCTWPKMCLKWLLSIQDSFLSVTRLSTFFYWSTKLLAAWLLMNVYAKKQFHFRQGIAQSTTTPLTRTINIDSHSLTQGTIKQIKFSTVNSSSILLYLILKVRVLSIIKISDLIKK